MSFFAGLDPALPRKPEVIDPARVEEGARQIAPLTKGRAVHFVMRYDSIAVGREAKVVRAWQEPQGYAWVRLFLGLNAGGQRMLRTVRAEYIQPL